MGQLESARVRGDITMGGEEISLDLATSTAGDCTGTLTLDGAEAEVLSVGAVQGPGPAGCDIGNCRVVDPGGGSAHQGSAVGDVQVRDAGELTIQAEEAAVDVGGFRRGVSVESDLSV